MARKTNTMMNTQRCIPLSAPGDNTVFFDIAECLSITNRRLYRQNRVYRARLKLRASYLDGANEGFTGEVYTINNTWLNRKAYGMAKAVWDKAHADEIASMKASGLNAVARWRDFKTKLGATNGRIGPVGPKYDAVANDFVVEELTPTATNYDWDASTVVKHDFAGSEIEFGFNWLAAAGNNFNIIEQVQRVYDVQETPNSPVEYNTPYDSVVVNSTELIDIEFDNVMEDGHMPPYDKENVDNVLAHVATIGSKFVDPAEQGNDGHEIMMLDTGWFDAPCGFVILDGPLFSDLHTMDLCIEVASGDYKGVKAPQFA